MTLQSGKFSPDYWEDTKIVIIKVYVIKPLFLGFFRYRIIVRLMMSNLCTLLGIRIYLKGFGPLVQRRQNEYVNHWNVGSEKKQFLTFRITFTVPTQYSYMNCEMNCTNKYYTCMHTAYVFNYLPGIQICSPHNYKENFSCLMTRLIYNMHLTFRDLKQV